MNGASKWQVTASIRMSCGSQGKSLNFRNATEAQIAENNAHKFFCGQDLQMFSTNLTEVGGKTPTDFNKTGLGHGSGISSSFLLDPETYCL